MKTHVSSNNHVLKKKLLFGKTNQWVFVSAPDKQMTLSSSSFVLPPIDQVNNAEIVQALDCVDSNFSFASTNNDAKKFQRMFPNSKIAESYRQAGTKTIYVLQFGIVPYFRKSMLKDFKDQPFTFKFDESFFYESLL